MARTEDPQKSLQMKAVHGYVPVGTACPRFQRKLMWSQKEGLCVKCMGDDVVDRAQCSRGQYKPQTG